MSNNCKVSIYQYKRKGNERKQLTEKVLLAIYKNDFDAFWKALTPSRKSYVERKRIEEFLLEKQQFMRIAGHDRMAWKVFGLLVGACDEDLSAGDPDDPLHVALLKSYINAYRGCIIHVAVVLNRIKIVEKLINFAKSFQGGRGVERMMLKEDSARRTALMVAVDEDRCRVTIKILDMLLKVPNCLGHAHFPTACNIVRRAISNFYNSDSLRLKSPYLKALSCLLCRARKCYDPSHQTASWHIMHFDLTSLTRHMTLKQSKGLTEGPELLNWTVLQYADYHLNQRQKDILLYLMNSQDASVEQGRPSLNDVRSCAPLEGTAVHFALGLMYMDMCEPHPGFGVNADRLLPHGHSDVSDDKMNISNSEVHCVIEMVEFLRDNGADLCKLNGAGKTPLATLSCDAPDDLIKIFVDYSQQQEQ